MVIYFERDYLDKIIKSGKINYRLKKNSERKIRYLYDLIDKTHNIVERNLKNRKIMIERDIVGKDLIKIPIGFNSYFFPETIQKFIIDNQKKQLVYSFKINKRNIKVYFTLLCEDDITELYEYYIQRIIEWLYICDKYSQNCGKLLEIFIYQTEFKKQLPVNYGDTIGPENVNSGFSTSCSRENEIVVYRKEEWFKVFIHETFHAYGLDIHATLVDKIQNKLKDMFSLKNDKILIGEAYSEVWARIINVLFYCYFKTSSYKDFKLCFIFSLEIERLFGTIQSNKILNHYGLTYVDIISNNKTKINMYKENTNTFCYYILSSLLMQEPYIFLEWCCKTNTQWLRFNNNEETIEQFINLIRRIYKNDDVVELFNEMYTSTNVLRMTLIDL
jgi:hypothetical protein